MYAFNFGQEFYEEPKPVEETQKEELKENQEEDNKTSNPNETDHDKLAEDDFFYPEHSNETEKLKEKAESEKSSAFNRKR